MKTHVHKVMRYAIYTRCASDEPSRLPSATKQQEDHCKKVIANNAGPGWLLAGLYEDFGQSGVKWGRPALQRLLSDISSDLVDVVIVYDLERLARDLRQLEIICQILAAHGVKLLSCREPHYDRAADEKLNAFFASISRLAEAAKNGGTK